MELETMVEVNSTKINTVQIVQPAQNKTFEQIFFDKTGKDFNTFYKHYYNKLVWTIQRMNINSIDAEDLTNQAFMQALRKIEMYNPQYHFSTWLFDIGKKMAYQFKKDEKKREMCVDTTASNDDGNEFDAVQHYLRSKMDNVEEEYNTQNITAVKYNETLREISKLDPKYRRIIELSDIQGKTYNEICDILGIELQTVKNRLHHGRIKLEKNLVDRFKEIELNY